MVDSGEASFHIIARIGRARRRQALILGSSGGVACVSRIVSSHWRPLNGNSLRTEGKNECVDSLWY